MRSNCLQAWTRHLLLSTEYRHITFRKIPTWLLSSPLTVHCPARFVSSNKHFLSRCQFVSPAKSGCYGFGNSFRLVEQRRNITVDRETTALTIWKDLKHIKFSPLPALVLGFSGLVPFAAPPVYMIYAQTFVPQMVFAELAYGACILSFLGGVRWGFVILEGRKQRADWLNLSYSVAPSLVAWMGLLMPVPFGVLTVMCGIAGAAYFDATMIGYPRWFKGLRFMLSLGAVLSLWTAYLCQYLLREKELPLVQEEN